MTFMMMKSFYDRMYSKNNHVFDKICKNVLPKIYHQINELIVEQNSMERVLHNINFPQLYSLTLLDFSENVLFNHSTSNKILRKLLIEQIAHLKVDINYEPVEPSSETLAMMFALILSLCKQLIKLNFCKWFHRAIFCTFNLSSIDFKSLTLTTLKMNVKSFDDCLYLLDGRLNCLSKLIIGGMFDNVQSLIMTDIYPFENNFFNVISQSFPLLKELYIFNEKPQKNKQQSMTLIVFSHLIDLDLSSAHADYAEQFLVDKHCYLPCLLNINIRYEPLALVTNNFTNDATRLTCSKLTSVCIEEPFVSLETFSKYFPLL
ncbi:unnamed protein product [Rotaria magnacalcarata]|uniref:Uncharacterized protein n=1 Tax=Rotaria magnacalcarata TaxID=392030 RepID=A0A8S2QR11_9BILA|nr:unnamed protein product [Rotaria magnacalcarata]CAF4138829.1 unnamed protein product [Rotaria magnacalcarata]